MFLSSADVAHMSRMQAHLLPDTCTLRTVTQTSDGSGGWTEGTSDVTAVPCRLMVNAVYAGREVIQADQVRPERTYILTIPETYTLTPKMRIVKAGVTYEVISVNEGASYGTALRATLTRVEA